MQKLSEAAVSRAMIRGVGAALVLLVLGWSIAVAYSLHSAFPHNPVALPGERALHLHAWLPEGWGFFTRDPREGALRPYREAASREWKPVESGMERRFLGFGRRARAEGFELNTLLKQVPTESWVPCERDPAACIEAGMAAAELQNTATSPTICGNVAFVMQEPVPWAWRASQVVMPSRYVRVYVKC
jgi:sporulation delaying protein A